MMAIWLSLMFGVVLVAQQPQDPAKPFPNHEQPPNGWFCARAETEEQATKDAHACLCVGMSDRPCEGAAPPYGLPDGSPGPMHDNAKCKVSCHMDNCTCEMHCTDSN